MLPSHSELAKDIVGALDKAIQHTKNEIIVLQAIKLISQDQRLNKLFHDNMGGQNDPNDPNDQSKEPIILRLSTKEKRTIITAARNQGKKSPTWARAILLEAARNQLNKPQSPSSAITSQNTIEMRPSEPRHS